MSVYRTVTVTPKLSANQVQATPQITENITSPASVVSKVQVNNTSDYNLLKNKPQIESVELQGNKTFDDLGLTKLSNMQIEQIIGGLNNGND